MRRLTMPRHRRRAASYPEAAKRRSYVAPSYESKYWPGGISVGAMLAVPSLLFQLAPLLTLHDPSVKDRPRVFAKEHGVIR